MDPEIRTLSSRTEKLRKAALDGHPDLQLHRASLYWEGYKASVGRSVNLRRARALASVYEGFPALILPDERIVGVGVGEKYGQWGFPEFWAGGPASVQERIQAVEEAGLEEPFRSQMLQIAMEVGESLLGNRASLSDGDQFREGWDLGVYWASGTYINHSVQDYGKLLKKGLEGILGEIDEAIAGHEYSSDDPLSGCRRSHLEAFREVTLAAAGLGLRYAKEARRLAALAESGEEKERLEKIASVCGQVPLRPARTFREAAQSLWFGHLLICLEDHVNANSLGRIDQWLAPYYDADSAAGLLTSEEALEILEALWLKLYRTYDVQQATIGGQLRDGKDATHPVSWLCLEATRRLNLIRCLSVRVHDRTPEPFLREAFRLVAKGHGVPFFFNDEAVVPALEDKGIPAEDARQYAVIGCVEIVIPGRSCPHAVSFWINLGRCLELTLYGGKDPISGKQVGPPGKGLDGMGSVDALYEEYLAFMRWANRKALACSNAGELNQERTLPMPMHSLFTEDCVGKGMDVTGGGARYNYHSVCAVGIPNVADSLSSIQRLVLEERRVGVEELLCALKTDFKNQERLRQLLLHGAPKYGNDDALPDGWAARISRDFCGDLAELRTVHGGSCFAHLFSFTSHLSFGKQTGALPDGRRSSEPLAYSLSPQQGRDVEGLSALLQSLCGVPHHLAAGSSSIIVEVTPEMMEGETFEKTFDAFRCAFQKGLGQLQVNVVSAERLREAQEAPERHENLCVRVSGFSQRFVTLSRDLQEHIIARTKHDRG